MKTTDLMTIEKTPVGAMQLLAYHCDGAITDPELIAHLCEFPWEVIRLLPDLEPALSREPGIKELVIELKAGVANGDAEIVCGGC